MNRQEKVSWMERWCVKQGLELILEGECGIGRECVGIISGKGGNYPDYEWYDAEYDQEDNNGEVFIPDNAYHKHPCVAVLGRGEEAEGQLYDWLKWFEDNNFDYVVSSMDTTGMHPIQVAINGGKNYRMVKQRNK